MNRAILNKQINKAMIDKLKNNTQSLLSFLQNQNNGTIVYVLEKLGRLENGNSKKPLLNLLNNPNENIRALSIKNLAKISDISLLPIFVKYASDDESTEVRRESVSAIGRLRNEKAIPTLINFLTDNNPKVVMQAIRGLLVFLRRPEVKQEKKLSLTHQMNIITEHDLELTLTIKFKGVSVDLNVSESLIVINTLAN